MEGGSSGSEDLVDVLLGIDVGFRGTGLAVLDIQTDRLLETFSIRPKDNSRKEKIRKSANDVFRIRQIVEGMKIVLDTWNVRAAFIEFPSGSKSARAAWTMGLAGGVIIGVLDLRDIVCEYFSPYDVKMATVGARDASKEAVEKAVRRRWRDFDGWPKFKADREHACDAAGILACAERTSDIYRLLRGKGRDNGKKIKAEAKAEDSAEK